MRDPMKLLFCIKALANPAGGAERVLTDIANGLAMRGHAVSLLTFEPPSRQSFYPLDAAVRHIGLGIGSTTTSARPRETLQRIGALRNIAKREQPHIVIGFMHSIFMPLGLALLGTGIPLIASEHNVPAHYGGRPLQRALLRLMPLLAHRITCVSEQAGRAYPAGLRRVMVPVPNPVTVSGAARAEVVGTECKTLLAVGRLHPQKDYATLIAAFGLLAREFPDWALRIVGDGAERPMLERQIAAAGLADRIALPGSTTQIAREYLGAQFFVTSSLYESFGLTTAEALTHGLPVVGFADCPGTNELIADGVNGVLVDPGEDRAASLARALRPVMADSGVRLRLASCPRRLPERFRLENVLDRWEILIAEACGHG